MKKYILLTVSIVCSMLAFCGCSDGDSNHPMLKKAGQSMRMGEYRNAEICYKKYLAKNPGNASVHYALANLYDEHLEEYLLAVYHYKESLRLQPDVSAETVKNIEEFIKRCEQRYMKKGKSVKKVFLTDEQEILRMTAAYKKNLAEQQKKTEAEIARMKAEAEKVKEQNLADKQLADSDTVNEIKEKVIETAEKKAGVEKDVKKEVEEQEKNLSETLTADTALVSEKVVADTPVMAEKVKADSPLVSEKNITDSAVVPEKVETAKPNRKVIKDFSKLPPMPEEKAAKISAQNEKIQEYKVKKGDTFSHLSRKFYGSIRYHKKLMEYNKISSPNALRVGKTVKIPPLHILTGERNEK